MTTTIKDAAQAAVRARETDVIELSHRIHSHPELGFEEVKASGWISASLDELGYEVTSGVGDLPTAFEARIGSGPLHVAICAEYDCLPEIGHACGHNIIAAAAMGAAAGLAACVDDLGITLRVLGTPAEEGGGGKVLMLERGVFDGVHVAMMVHPAPVEVLRPTISAAAHFDVTYSGVAAHAAAAPERGVNALDALVVAQTGIGLLRQHLPASARVHGFVTEAGDAVNVVPAHAHGRWMVRGTDLEEMRATRGRVERCFEAGALATGAKLEIADFSADYAHMVHDDALVDVYRSNAQECGRTFPDGDAITFSTDMGNVSLAVPSIHPTVAIESGGFINHQPEFAAACVNDSADRAAIEGAVSMAWTTIDVAQGELRETLLNGHPS